MTQGASLNRILCQWRSQKPDLDPTCMAVCGAIWRAGKRLTDGLKPNLDRYQLDFSGMDVLLTLRRNGVEAPMSPKEMSEDMMLSTGAMTARLDRLEARGLILRRPRPGDRRALLVSLTPAGVDLVDTMLDGHIAAEERMLSGLNATERQTLLTLLSRIAHDDA
ncbi:HTH-type transcriptional regulator MhqR [Roseivivax jejudonensis]|uniref:HTH-type transcriptional regulator MhqR n=2 Tax=Roseivivax jejudonensis TaxID=1529041 RepID=A0A1X7A5X9_9RHOB|nr:HTH-type transcriptional regulator MhqR [Roseivivax jejudonensis]